MPSAFALRKVPWNDLKELDPDLLVSLRIVELDRLMHRITAKNKGVTLIGFVKIIIDY